MGFGSPKLLIARPYLTLCLSSNKSLLLIETEKPKIPIGILGFSLFVCTGLGRDETASGDRLTPSRLCENFGDRNG
jgi:hypothetical protein